MNRLATDKTSNVFMMVGNIYQKSKTLGGTDQTAGVKPGDPALPQTAL